MKVVWFSPSHYLYDNSCLTRTNLIHFLKLAVSQCQYELFLLNLIELYSVTASFYDKELNSCYLIIQDYYLHGRSVISERFVMLYRIETTIIICTACSYTVFIRFFCISTMKVLLVAYMREAHLIMFPFFPVHFSHFVPYISYHLLEA